MQRLATRLYQPDLSAECGADVPPDAAAQQHLKARRLRIGDALAAFDGRGGEWRAEVTSLGRREAVVRLLEPIERTAESPLAITLVQGISKGDRMDYAVQKAVELGVHRILPVFTEHGVVRLEPARAANRLEHWRRVAISACEQCGRNRLPEVARARTLAVVWPEIAALTGVVLDPDGDMRPSALPSPADDFAVIVGPEGGLSDDEQGEAVSRGCHRVTLGPRVLRTETAAVAALAALQARHGDL